MIDNAPKSRHVFHIKVPMLKLDEPNIHHEAAKSANSAVKAIGYRHDLRDGKRLGISRWTLPFVLSERTCQRRSSCCAEPGYRADKALSKLLSSTVWIL